MIHEAWLYDDKGELHHTWSIDYYALDPDGPSNDGDTPQAFHVLPDGSIIVGWDAGDVMVRLDACSEPIWTKEGVFHHAISRADDGTKRSPRRPLDRGHLPRDLLDGVGPGGEATRTA